jgi:hypothetical protein
VCSGSRPYDMSAAIMWSLPYSSIRTACNKEPQRKERVHHYPGKHVLQASPGCATAGNPCLTCLTHHYLDTRHTPYLTMMCTCTGLRWACCRSAQI